MVFNAAKQLFKTPGMKFIWPPLPSKKKSFPATNSGHQVKSFYFIRLNVNFVLVTRKSYLSICGEQKERRKSDGRSGSGDYGGGGVEGG